jgi:hypothetical protein
MVSLIIHIMMFSVQNPAKEEMLGSGSDSREAGEKKNSEQCSNCKQPEKHCLHGQEVHFLHPDHEGCRVTSTGPYWTHGKRDQGATVQEVTSLSKILVRWDKARKVGRSPKGIKQEVSYDLRAHHPSRGLFHVLIFAFQCK